MKEINVDERYFFLKPEKSLSVCFLKMIFMNENLLSDDDVIGFDCDDEFIYILIGSFHIFPLLY